MLGRSAQLQADRRFFGGSRIAAFEVTVTDFRSAGSLAYATGTGRHTVADIATGEPRVDTFQYVEILVLEEDNHWRSRYFMNAPHKL